MKTATVRELRNRYISLLRRVSAGEKIVITKHGKPVARLIPEKDAIRTNVTWSKSYEVTRDRSAEATLGAKAKRCLLADSSGSA